MPRPSSLADAKASTLCPYSLDLHQAGHKTYSVINVRTCNSQNRILPEEVAACQTPTSPTPPGCLRASQRKRRCSITDSSTVSNRFQTHRHTNRAMLAESSGPGTLSRTLVAAGRPSVSSGTPFTTVGTAPLHPKPHGAEPRMHCSSLRPCRPFFPGVDVSTERAPVVSDIGAAPPSRQFLQ